ncbi:MBL fold metallo-hydrolase RNA specificity domain-containing protein [Ostreibacterium oceani]|uniref:MBL fold metallo-hydrolase n=1 Tax=Ostreibacterium oceani TaxID=2654998 RepID=A0A6N7EUJ1_9GAMM|nr:MBL fold metallo-hydrolase [Ostreibacterium oceani]MPV85653.1 MBL fold metallo-hydrolase [Ostreibacterium oceani]
MKIEFYGAASGTVTGSCHILHVGQHKILLDCGLIQGSRQAFEQNREPFPFEPSAIDAVILSHAHIDHSGRLPRLVKEGYHGTIHTHNATVDLCEILFKDSAKLAQYDAERYNKKNKGKRPLYPLYDLSDVDDTLKKFNGHSYQAWFEPLAGIKVRFHDAGHILGSAIVELIINEDGNEKTIVFSGDIGQFNSPILQDPTLLEKADIVLMESTYGGREHKARENTYTEIGEIIASASADQGNILIPAFSVGRTQEILYQLVEHYDEWQIDNWATYLDSPMAIEASKVYWDFKHLHDNDAKRLLGDFGNKIPLPNYKRTVTPAESKHLNTIESGCIFIAGSGMCNGGRIIHHLRHNITRPECHVIIVGYQAGGTLGRRLVNGEKRIKMFGEWLEVKAQIHTVGGLSAHADQADMFKWLSHFKTKPDVYLVHGEDDSRQAFKDHVEQHTDLTVHCPVAGDVVMLDG